MSEILPLFVILVIMAANIFIVFGLRALNLSVETTALLEPILELTLIAGMMTNIVRWGIKEQCSDLHRSPREAAIFVTKWFNPFTNILVGVPYLIFIVAKGAVLFLTLLPRFVRNVFILIHSELRLLCLLDGGLGAVAGTLIVGTLAGTLVGALAGGVFGVLNFEIVSKRLLRLVPLR